MRTKFNPSSILSTPFSEPKKQMDKQTDSAIEWN